MRKKIGFLTIILVGLLAFSSCKLIPIHFAPDLAKEFKKIGINFEDRNSVLRLEKEPELFPLWARWRPIKQFMLKEERKIVKSILKMENLEDRNYHTEKFIEFFWKRRDSNLYDDENEVRNDFYNRVVEAQTRFAQKEDAQYFRRCKYGKGWQTDMGLMYILAGEPFDKARYDFERLMSMSGGGGYSQSGFMPTDIEVWYYDVPLDEYWGELFQNGVAWILFERDSSGYWSYGATVFNLFYNYENYMSYSMGGMSWSYSMYLSEIDKFLQAVAKDSIYDKDLTYEEMFYKWVTVKEEDKK